MVSRKQHINIDKNPIKMNLNELFNLFKRTFLFQDWMDNPSDPVESFAWGSTTKGLFLWSEPFFISTQSDEEVVFVLF